MIEPLAVLAVGAVQLLQAGLIALGAWLVLSDVRAGTLRFRRAVATWAFYGAALAPLAGKLPRELVIDDGSGPAFSLRYPTFDFAAAPEQLRLAAAAVVAVTLIVASVRIVRTLADVWAGERLARKGEGRRIAFVDVAGPMTVGLLHPVVLLP
jgi:hypothetical protein